MWTEYPKGRQSGHRQIEAILAKVGAWRGKRMRYCPVGGGISNLNWRVRVQGQPQDYFVKVPGRGTQMFVDRNAAHEASLKAQACGYGAPVVAYLADEGVEIFGFLDGFRASGNLDFLRPALRLNAVAGLRAFNDSGPLSLTKTVFDMIDEHVEQVRQLGAWQPPDLCWMLAHGRQARSALAACGMDLVPCMNDTLAGNFMIDGQDRVRLVDFEYASNNERAYELALWFGEMFFATEVQNELLEAYHGRHTQQAFHRVQVLRALADLKWAAWAMVQERVSTLAFDFRKYGAWKYMRARGQFQHADWPHWLRNM